ncbi:MAG: hypothetical protein EOP86_26435 [Verrucomicrobiaceae bacterium]|nr:MAG: hypothetical protein EOP86_26435 [Verrucomicrobiaceae bacterium]
MHQLVQLISDDTPADAFEWARTIKTRTWRDEALKDAVQAWSRQDPAAADQAMETLPARDRARLRDMAEAVKEEEAAEQK